MLTEKSEVVKVQVELWMKSYYFDFWIICVLIPYAGFFFSIAYGDQIYCISAGWIFNKKCMFLFSNYFPSWYRIVMFFYF